MMDRLWWKRLLRYIVLPWVVIALVLGGIYYVSLQTRYEVFAQKEVSRLENIRTQIRNTQGHVIEDLFLFSSMKEANLILQSDDAAAKETLAYFATRLMRSRNYYDQIRLLDAQGMERLRVDYRDGQPQVIAESFLQDKSKRYYYQNSKTLKPNQLFISPLDLNVENEAIELPEKPMVRYVIGVYDGRSDNPIGFIVINYLVDYLFKTLDQIMLGSTDLLCMVNTNGYYMYGVEPSHSWGWLFPERSEYTLAQDNPELWEQISQSDAGRLKQQDASWFFIANDITKAAEYDIARIKGGMMENTVASLRYAERLIVVLKVPRSYWMEETAGVRQVLWIVGIICFLLSPIVSLRFYNVKKHNKVLHEQLVQDAKFDAFTNTYNRKAGFSVMDEMLKYTASANIISSLCFIDLNNLKKINDQYGHEAGDAFITFCVKCLKDAFPEDTVIVRMGGDEFLLFLPCTSACAFDQLEKVNATLMKESMQKGYPILWSFSYGCVEIPPKGRESLDTMITKADALMYVQKKKFKKNNQNSAE